MNLRFALMLLVGLLSVTAPVLAEPTSPEVIAAIKKLGGEVKLDENKAVVRVNLYNTKVTDVGLVHLKGLSELKELYLWETKVTDAGLAYLKGLSSLEVLSLPGPKITDAGLAHLKGLTKLETLRLEDTQVTDAGLKNLRQALPNCMIEH